MGTSRIFVKRRGVPGDAKELKPVLSSVSWHGLVVQFPARDSDTQSALGLGWGKQRAQCCGRDAPVPGLWALIVSLEQMNFPRL